MRRNFLRLVFCSVDPGGAEAPLPTEFRLFKAGANETTKGTFVLDAEGMAATLAAFARGGVDLPIDLEHDSLEPAARAARSDAGDARGWFSLADRGGELWAVGVTWTPDGEARLRQRTQRYISPAFAADEAGRIVEVFNCALVSMPATLCAEPLVASRETKTSGCAKRRRVTTGRAGMDPKLVKEALDALIADDAAKALEILKGLIASAAGAEAAPDAGGEPPPVAESADPPPAAESADPPPAALAAAPPAPVSALSADDAAELATLRAERIERDLTERRGLIAGLVQLGAETPATAWHGDAAKRVPVKRLAEEPLTELRARVEALRAARPVELRRVPALDSVGLNTAEQSVYDSLPNDAAKRVYLARRAARKAS